MRKLITAVAITSLSTSSLLAAELNAIVTQVEPNYETCLLYTSPSPRDAHESRMPSSA